MSETPESPPAPPPPARFDASAVCLVLVLLLPVFAMFRQGLADPDLWWHLRSGRWIVEQGRVPWEDPFSYTARGRPWIAYSWLSEVLFYALTRHAGFDALILFAAAAGATLLGFMFLACRATGAGKTASLAVCAFAGAATSGAWAERPQLLSFVLLAALVYCIHSPRFAARLPLIAPALFALWANVHILFSIGLGLLGLAAVCQWVQGRRAPAPWLALATALLGTLVNPYGWRLLEHLHVIAAQPGILRSAEELQSPDFATTLGMVIGAFVVSSIAVLALSRRRKTAFELSSFLGTLAGGLYMARNVAIFAIVAAPTVARHLDGLLPRAALSRVSRPALALHYLVVALALCGAAALAPRSPDWRANIAPGIFPVAAADFVADRYPGRRLFNDFDSGGFLIFRLYPSTLVSMDGRSQVYGPRLLRAYLRTHFVNPGWDAFVNECDPEVILWPAQSPFAVLLEAQPAWKRVFADSVAVVYVRADRPP